MPKKRGRPPNAGGATTAAERQKRYRARKKAAGVVVRQFDRAAREALEDLRLDAADREIFRDALRELDYLREEVKRLGSEKDHWQVELKREVQFHTITRKELIVARDQLAVLKKRGS